ncbi:FHA domain-containing protein [Alkalibacter rhizosphaerae]|uniref:FHA domain-containing protein n=1 Tax=Alkalibacter rhizosphaerae TaxID=2815577 RepID=A0A974XF61_9FIRM|nr:FHA domain-containing protein [Alkalibacter rhizosphaerae]QSX08621.1 FHA domain-containing protein [Alkalibacter rhizosphaerae]
MFDLLASLFKYLFIIFIYYFMYVIIRLIYLDIATTTVIGRKLEGNLPYLKLVNRRESLTFRVEESYFLEGDMILGRSGKNHIVIKDPFLSGSHAKFHVEDGRWFINDLNSKNGTMLNHQQLGEDAYELGDGDLVHLGQLDFLFVEPGRNRS